MVTTLIWAQNAIHLKYEEAALETSLPVGDSGPSHPHPRPLLRLLPPHLLLLLHLQFTLSPPLLLLLPSPPPPPPLPPRLPPPLRRRRPLRRVLLRRPIAQVRPAGMQGPEEGHGVRFEIAERGGGQDGLQGDRQAAVEGRQRGQSGLRVPQVGAQEDGAAERTRGSALSRAVWMSGCQARGLGAQARSAAQEVSSVWVLDSKCICVKLCDSDC
ncbi:hypothetical protein TIFTF001_015768 [Ficus carica]|uniref:Uncharacterized protein n=1 Tax=Ficus carica TaxID=3494 RepID=A0AA88A930_FICCA|nr:hypothetical protein TIFTF001_015768 [Ficus carica]